MVRQGDIIWMDFDPQTGHEQSGRRPAVVVSNNDFNRFSKAAIVCPITNTDKNHRFHVRLNHQTSVKGVILCDQQKTLDIDARNYEMIERLPNHLLLEVIDLIKSFVEPEE